MKVTEVEIFQVKSKRPGWRPVFCRIHTDEGIYGDGEAALTFAVGAPAVFGMLKDLSRMILGMDPLKNEVIWDKLYKRTLWGQNGGLVIFAAISAIDIALWDIKGKYFNVPVHALLGGKRRDELRTYASQLQMGWGEEKCRDSNEMCVPHVAVTPEDYAENALEAVKEGYDCVKFNFFNYAPDGHAYNDDETCGFLNNKYIRIIEERVRAVREAVGPDVDIIMENHSRFDAQSAIQVAKAVEKYNIYFFEEPNTPSPKTAKFIRDNINIPISHGERIYTRWQFAPYFEDQSIQLIQPDIGNCGGITEVKKICDMAYVYDIGVQAHVCASPLSTAAALHLEAVIPNFVIHEHHVYNLHNYNRELCTVDFQPVNGKFKVPDGPGLGAEISETAIACSEVFTVKPR